MLAVLVLLILLGAPIGFSMAILPTAYIVITDVVPLSAVPYQMYTALNKFPLVAVPMFLFAGELMNLGEVTDRLLRLSREMVGRIRGGLSHITIVMSMLFASLNGSAVASTATIGGIMIPAMKKAGYSSSFSASTTAVASTIGGIIPPSIAIVIFASVNNLSVGKLFPPASCRESWSASCSWLSPTLSVCAQTMSATRHRSASWHCCGPSYAPFWHCRCR
jgi:tripartite ATP-independent transporter DctM subunit